MSATNKLASWFICPGQVSQECIENQSVLFTMHYVLLRFFLQYSSFDNSIYSKQPPKCMTYLGRCWMPFSVHGCVRSLFLTSLTVSSHPFLSRHHNVITIHHRVRGSTEEDKTHTIIPTYRTQPRSCNGNFVTFFKKTQSNREVAAAWFEGNIDHRFDSAELKWATVDIITACCE